MNEVLDKDADYDGSTENESNKPDFEQYAKVHAEGLKRFKLAKEAENENREEAERDAEFRNGNQWPDNIKRGRGKRPTLTINRTDAFVRRVVNEMRRSRPSIKVSPADSKASVAVAKIYGGLIRNIERNSHADNAYDTAADQMVGSGFGHFRIVTEYCDGDGFQQDLRIVRIPNQFTVYSDPFALEPDWSDGDWRFVVEAVDPDDFEDEHGFKPATMKELDEPGMADWFDGDRILVAEYWRVVKTKVVKYLMPDGQVVDGSPNDKQLLAQLAGQGIVPKRREVTKRSVEQYLMTGEGCFKKADYQGKYIPIVSMVGRELWIKNKRILKSLIRDAKDPARMYNYWASMETEQVALQSKAPTWVPKGALRDPDIRKKWDTSNVQPWPYLEYEVVEGRGPERSPGPTMSDGARQGRTAAVEDMKAVMDMQDPTMGKPITGDASGVAVEEYKQQGDTATYDFIDNQAKALRQCGRILVDLIPRVYDGPRIARILEEDGTPQQVPVNAKGIVNGQEVMYDLRVGEYDVAVDAGPAYQTQRQEARAGQLALLSAQPQLATLIGDLVVKNMDWPQAEEMAARIRKGMDPSITGDGIPPAIQQQMEQGKQYIAQLEQQLKKAHDHITEQQFDVQKHQIDAKAKEASANGALAKASVEQERIALERDRLAVDTFTAKARNAVDMMEIRLKEMQVISESMGQNVDITELQVRMMEARAQIEALQMPALMPQLGTSLQ